MEEGAVTNIGIQMLPEAWQAISLAPLHLQEFFEAVLTTPQNWHLFRFVPCLHRYVGQAIQLWRAVQNRAHTTHA